MKTGYCLTGSFCTFDKAFETIKGLVKSGNSVTPIMSENAFTTDTRFGTAKHMQDTLVEITGNSIIHTIVQAEPIGPKKLFDILIVAPCTANTLAKLANGIVDTSVTMAVKSHLRNNRPVLIGVSTNDALGAAAKNIGVLMNTKNYYFVPFSMDNYEKKPKSMVCDFTQIEHCAKLALEGREISKKIY
ncbi:MAG: dipicolinate synthase subunit B [Eubacterium sp.]|nr:dipicolinate synthase subunit B [Eubacterium sp.]